MRAADPADGATLDWLPTTCAYRLRGEGEPLPDWHYLISGDRESVHAAGQSTRGWTVSEDEAGDLETPSSSTANCESDEMAIEVVRHPRARSAQAERSIRPAAGCG